MKLVIVGAGGRLGAALVRTYREKFGLIGFNHAQLDLANRDEMRRKLCAIDFDLLINAAAFTNVDLCETQQIDAIADKFSTPTYTRDLAQMLLQFFEQDVEGGILHFTSAGECSWQEYAQWALDCCASQGIAVKAKTVGALKLTDMKNWVARRPVYSVLSTAKYSALTGVSPRVWRDAVADYIRRFYSQK